MGRVASWHGDRPAAFDRDQTITTTDGERRQERAQDARAHVLGCAIDRFDLEESLAYCEAAIDGRGFAQHMAINVAKLVTMRRDDELRTSIERCELITADGQPIVWASRLLGDPVPCRVAGIDLMEHLLARAAAKGYRVYILGATTKVLELAVHRMRSELPNLCLAGYHHGYYDDADEADLAGLIAAARPDILFVAMSSPRKEYFLARHGHAIGAPFVMGVGGAIDVYAGIVQRAPVLIQRLGLEWLFRLMQEPRRLGPRYASTNTRFIALLALELLRAHSVRPPVRTRVRVRRRPRAEQTATPSTLPPNILVPETLSERRSQPPLVTRADPLQGARGGGRASDEGGDA